MNLRRLLPSLALFLSGCASSFQGYPSLAKRAIEDAPIAEAAAQPSPVAPEPELVQSVDRLTAQAQAGGTAFDKAWPAADKAARAASGSAQNPGWACMASRALRRSDLAGKSKKVS